MSTIPWTEAMDGSPACIIKRLEDLASDGRMGGNPSAVAIAVRFQAGPLSERGVNGCSIEDVIDVLTDRLHGFQNGPFKCRENAMAITKLEEAKLWLLERTRKRQAQGVEGTSTAHKETPVA